MKISKVLLTTLLLIMFVSPITVYSATITRAQSLVDTSLADQSAKQYVQPQNIWITNIKPGTYDVAVDSKYWYQLLYYYSITRLGYADIPFTYVVDREGNSYDGREGGVGVAPESYQDKGGVLIGYLSTTPDLSLAAEQKIKNLVSDASFRYGIKLKNVKVVDITSVKSSARTTKSKYVEVSDTFSTNVFSAISSMPYFDKEHISYTGEVTELTYPKTVNSGEKIEVNVSIKNTDTFPWFSDKEYIYLTTADYKDSPFAVNGKWDSFSKPLSVSNKTVLPGEVLKLKFNMQGMLIPGKHTEQFQLAKLPKNNFKGTKFNVTFEIKKGNTKLVQVKETPSGYLNVRTCPGPTCSEIAKVSDGQTLIMLEKSNGWYRIRYSDKGTGWVYGPYILEL